MLDKAYANHSTFMATSTEIWAGLQDFTPTVIYHKDSIQTDNEQAIDEKQEKDTTEYREKRKIKHRKVMNIQEYKTKKCAGKHILRKGELCR